MNRDYSKFLELLNKDAEKERNENAEKAVYDNLYNKGFRDGLSVLDKIRAEIEKEIIPRNSDQYDHEAMWQNMGLRMALKVIDKYKAESGARE